MIGCFKAGLCCLHLTHSTKSMLGPCVYSPVASKKIELSWIKNCKVIINEMIPFMQMKKNQCTC